MSLTKFPLIAIPISVATACGLSIGNKEIYEIIINIYNKHKNNMNDINKQLNLLINYTEKLYNIMYSMKKKMKVYVIFLIDVLKKVKKESFL